MTGKDSPCLLRDLLRRISRSWIVLPVLVLVFGAAVGFAASALTGDDGGDDGSVDTSTPTPPRVQGPAPSAGRSFLAKVIPPPAGSLSGAKPPGRIAALVKSMPIERKIAQLMIVAFDGTDATSPVLAQLKRFDWGGLGF